MSVIESVILSERGPERFRFAVVSEEPAFALFSISANNERLTGERSENGSFPRQHKGSWQPGCQLLRSEPHLRNVGRFRWRRKHRSKALSALAPCARNTVDPAESTARPADPLRDTRWQSHQAAASIAQKPSPHAS